MLIITNNLCLFQGNVSNDGACLRLIYSVKQNKQNQCRRN